MKKIYFLVLAVAMMAFSVSASAQFMNSSSSMSSSSAVESIFNTFDVTYSPMNLNAKYGDVTNSEKLNAVSLNWNQARAISTSVPVYLTYGAGVQYAWMTDSDDDWKSTSSFLTVKVPVNLLYNFNIPSTSVNLMPYVGLNLQGHILGQEKMTYSDGDSKETHNLNYFSKKDMDDEPFNRFVVGWQIGAKVAFNKYFVGVAYEGPVSNLYKEGDLKINYNGVNISLGLMF